jgi:hypothetical protein
MNIEIEIKNTGTFAYATVNINGVEMLSLPFASVEDANKWAESCKSDIESLHKECDCPKCRAEKEAKTAKPEPETKPEESTPTWTPEVGMLIKSDPTGIWQIEDVYANKALKVVDLNGEKGIIVSHLIPDYRPIAELEGLKVGDGVYSIDEDGIAKEFEIDEQYDGNLWIKACSVSIHSNNKGIPSHFGNGEQMFWRTKERAERFGK